MILLGYSSLLWIYGLSVHNSQIQKRVKKERKGEKGKKKLSVITNQNFFMKSTKSCLFCLWGQYPFWLLALLDVCFNMSVFSSQQNGAIMKRAIEWLDLRWDWCFLALSAKGRMISSWCCWFCILVCWEFDFYWECVLWKLNLILYLFPLYILFFLFCSTPCQPGKILFTH